MRFILCFLSAMLIGMIAHSQSHDSVTFAKISINGFLLGSKKTELEKKFGKPYKVVTTEEKGVDQYADYYYGKSTLRFSPAGIFNGFKLSDDAFDLSYNQHSVRVGSSLKEFAVYFPRSFESFAKDRAKQFKLKIRTGNTLIVLKTKDGIVTSIATKDQPK